MCFCLTRVLLSFHFQEVGSIIGKVDSFYNPSARTESFRIFLSALSLHFRKINQTYDVVISSRKEKR